MLKSFSILHSAIMCRRGSCPYYGQPFKGHVSTLLDLVEERYWADFFDGRGIPGFWVRFYST